MSHYALKSSHSGPALRIWLVDDDAFCRDHLTRSLNAEPRVDCARSFASALSLLAALRQEHPPDAILMDVYMPDMNGIEAIRPVRKQAPFTRVLILTTIFDLHVKKTALATGAAGFLLKRYPRDQLIDSLCSAGSWPRSPMTNDAPAINYQCPPA